MGWVEVILWLMTNSCVCVQFFGKYFFAIFGVRTMNAIESASRAAAELGSQYAKSVLVGLNPYAAMCNKMLKNVFTALESGEDTVENPFKDVVTDIKQG